MGFSATEIESPILQGVYLSPLNDFRHMSLFGRVEIWEVHGDTRGSSNRREERFNGDGREDEPNLGITCGPIMRIDRWVESWIAISKN